jgi:predicted esterase YcpF (UPF0227 family)
MNILYIHGFGSRVDPASTKYQALSQLGKVTAIAPDYSLPYTQNMRLIQQAALGMDLLVGTSMGACMASRASKTFKIPFIGINPVLLPGRTLTKYIGTHQDYYGKTYTLTTDVAASYPVFLISRRGLVLLDLGDDIIDATETFSCISEKMSVVTYAGGNHRFQHMEESIDLIARFFALVKQPDEGALVFHQELQVDHSVRKQPIVTYHNTEQSALHCPVCHQILCGQNSIDIQAELEEYHRCAHVKFIFIDDFDDPFDRGHYDYIHPTIREWLNFEHQSFTKQDDRAERNSELLLRCPLVNRIIVDKPKYPAPYYRVIFGVN